MGDIEIRDERAAGRLEAVADGEVVGRIECFLLDTPEHALEPVHTVVGPAHEGRGIAGSLARGPYAVAARGDGAVALLCPYVAERVECHPDRAPAAGPEPVRAAKEWPAASPGRL
ncbi:N-acetyltransferase [Streptomyces pimonensis]|uniref:N-acetyltransferase n=1 Tax=Streptomyces pimonensis TaxID=2860288 RepID=A0ABV4ITA6_9ACTN